VGSHKSRVERENHLPQPARHPALDAAQDTVGFWGCKWTFLTHAELLFNQNPQVLLIRATPQQGSGFLKAMVHTACTFSIPLCQGNALDQFFCEIPQILKLSCSDVYLKEVGLVLIILSLAL